MFESDEIVKSSVINSTAAAASLAPGKLSFISVGSKFRSQLALLMDKLRSTVRNYIFVLHIYLLVLSWVFTRATLC